MCLTSGLGIIGNAGAAVLGDAFGIYGGPFALEPRTQIITMTHTTHYESQLNAALSEMALQRQYAMMAQYRPPVPKLPPIPERPCPLHWRKPEDRVE